LKSIFDHLFQIDLFFFFAKDLISCFSERYYTFPNASHLSKATSHMVFEVQCIQPTSRVNVLFWFYTHLLFHVTQKKVSWFSSLGDQSTCDNLQASIAWPQSIFVMRKKSKLVVINTWCLLLPFLPSIMPTNLC
jgi:hypothetical protein